MSYVYIHAGLDDEVRVRFGQHVDEYAVRIGEATIFLPPAKAAELRDALTAALTEPEETPNGH